MIVRLINIYFQFFLFQLKSKLSYRINAVLQFIYGPSYVLILFFVLQLLYGQTSSMLGWSKQEALLLFTTFHVVYTFCIVLFLDGLRSFLWEGVRTGVLDTMLTKPLPTQFLVAFSKPGLDQLSLLIGLVAALLYQLLVWPTGSIYLVIAYFLSMALAVAIIYLTLSTYATLGFFMTRAGQIMELFDKSCDFAQYPPAIFPSGIQWITFSIMPIALFSFVPTSILLGKLSPWALLGMLAFVGLGLVLNRFAWNRALKSYSSASS